MTTKALLLALPTLMLFESCGAQIKNARTTMVHVSGNCSMCEETIEKAAVVKGQAVADWNKDTKQAEITFDTTHTDLDAVLRRIADAGYDNERYRAPDAAYAALPECCQYDREKQRATNSSASPASGAIAEEHHHMQGGEGATAQDTLATHGADGRLKAVFTAYFALKEAFTASDATLAKRRGVAFDEAVHSVPMEELKKDLHVLWMDVMPDLMDPAQLISGTSDIGKQRDAFAQLAAPMTRLAKAFPSGAVIYVDHCPMYNGGADWLSTEKPINNPFFGPSMPGCGSVTETIQP